MIPGETGYSIVIVGASSLLGRELRAVIKERRFPVARLMELESGAGAEAEPEPPVLDIERDEATEFLASQASVSGIDVAFIAAPSDPAQALLASGLPPLVIDVDGGLAEPHREPPQIAFLEEGGSLANEPVATPGAGKPATRVIASAHPVTAVLSTLLLRLASKVEITTAVAEILSPASHLGPRAIEELQKQTVNLLSFQKIPRAVFGSQLAFNLLPRVSGSGSESLGSLESRVRGELTRFLAGRAPLPALRLLQAPVFYSVAVSLYVETSEMIPPAKVAQAIAGEPIRISRTSERAPSQVEVTGSAEIIVDPITADAGRPNGLWMWAAADNLRLAAENAVRLAEQMLRTGQAAQVRGRVH
jgi:aspartate-semialdehyde dehydrogenase